MADVRIVPSAFVQTGNVLAFVERLDNAVFVDKSAFTLDTTSITPEVLGADGRLYFVPPAGLAGPFSQLVVEATGDTLTLETVVTGVTEQLACVQSLRSQLAVLRARAEAQVTWDRAQTMPELVVTERYWAVLQGGHLYLGAALEAIDDATPPSDPTAVAEAVNALGDEHSAELERFQAVAFS